MQPPARTELEEREYALKPMNCPGDIQIYAMERHSYRDLPIRLANFSKLHRYERSGVTQGLVRVRAFAQDDAHLFVTPQQIQPEIERELNGMALNVRHALRAAALATLLLEFFPEPLETPGPELFQIRRRIAAIVHI